MLVTYKIRNCYPRPTGREHPRNAPAYNFDALSRIILDFARSIPRAAALKEEEVTIIMWNDETKSGASVD